MSKNKNNETLLNVVVDDAGSDKTVVDVRRKVTYWHGGFYPAMNREIYIGGCSNFQGTQEYKINARSYFIDELVILESLPDFEKASGLVKCLRHYTFCEYKSPDRTLTIKDIDRLMGLTRLYVEGGDKSRNDVAALFVVSHFPRKALKELPDGGGLEKIEQGIYTRLSDNIPMSIVVIPELDKEKYRLLSSLRRNMSIEILPNLIDELSRHSNNELLLSYINGYIYWIFDAYANEIIEGEIEMTSKLFTA
ncbi:MAG: hypothetical protein LBH59_03600, partial [Planctomycetaceae bacterium]|nr:hypothetical protein [Planctomycetaceae bacterium]